MNNRVDLSIIKHDVPVDRAHVEVLKASMRSQGQLAPLLLRTQNKAVIDGFHRSVALKELGAKQAIVSFVDCTDEQFRNARIISAATHKGVSFARLTMWVREEFVQTKWAAILSTSEAFRLGGKKGDTLSMLAFEKQWHKGLGGRELYEIVNWVRAKSELWGLSPDQIANMLEIADSASPSLLQLVRPRRHRRENVLTRPMLAKIVKHIPNQVVQEAVAKKAMVEKLDEKETADLVLAIAADPPKEQLESILSTNWLDLKAAERYERMNARPKLTPEQQQAQGQAIMVNMTIALIDEVSGRVEALPKSLPTEIAADLEDAFTTLIAVIAEYRGQHVDAIAGLERKIEELDKANMLLVAEKESLMVQLKKLQNLIGVGQKMYREQAG